MAKKFVRLGPSNAAFNIAHDENLQDIGDKFHEDESFGIRLEDGGTLIINPALTPWIAYGRD